MPYGRILDIPVYRCGEKQHAGELAIEKRRLRALMYPNWRECDSKLLEEDFRGIGSNLYYCWEFNEIVGWIRLQVRKF